MKDMLRTLSRLDPALTAGASFAMIETSPRLADVQNNARRHACRDRLDESIDTLPQTPLFIVGNECSTRCRSASSSAPEQAGANG